MAKVVVSTRAFQSKDVSLLMRKKLGKLLYRQTVDRFIQGGDDEIRFVPLARKRPDGTMTNVLHPTGKHLLSHLGYDFDARTVSVKTEGPGAAHLQKGTVGKFAPGVGQGTMPTIKPVYAKALFIPISPKAAAMTSRDRLGGADVVAIREKIKSLRAKTGKQAARSLAAAQDKLEAAKQAAKGNGLIRGKDFVFASKVDLPPRPFLRISRKNRAEIARVLSGKPPEAPYVR